jgi:hypothetical protein
MLNGFRLGCSFNNGSNEFEVIEVMGSNRSNGFEDKVILK